MRSSATSPHRPRSCDWPAQRLGEAVGLAADRVAGLDQELDLLL